MRSLKEIEAELGAEQEAEQRLEEEEEAKAPTREVGEYKRILDLGDIAVNQEMTDGRGFDAMGKTTKSKVPTGNCFGIEVDSETGAFCGAAVVSFKDDKGYELQNVIDRARSSIDMILTPRTVNVAGDYGNFPPFSKDLEILTVVIVRKKE